MKNLTKKQKTQLLTWFIGFAEGDGSWQVVSDRNTTKSVFIINQKDPQILHKVKRLLKLGTVSGPYKNKDGSTYYRYRVGTLKGTKELINIFNGNLVLKKAQIRFESYVDAYNSRSTIAGTSSMVIFNDNRFLPTLEDGWLSGFIDAEGSFSGTTRKNKKKEGIESITSVTVRFSLVQKFEKEVFEHLKLLIGGSLQHEVKKEAYRLKLESKKDRDTIIEYLREFPLQSNKAVPFDRFRKIHIRLIDGKFKWRLESARAKARMVRLVENINKDI